MNKNALFEMVFEAYVSHDHPEDVSAEEILERALILAGKLSEKYGVVDEGTEKVNPKKDSTTAPSLDELAEGGKAIIDELYEAKDGLTFDKLTAILDKMDHDIFALSLKKLSDFGFVTVNVGDSPETTVIKLKIRL